MFCLKFFYTSPKNSSCLCLWGKWGHPEESWVLWVTLEVPASIRSRTSSWHIREEGRRWGGWWTSGQVCSKVQVSEGSEVATFSEVLWCEGNLTCPLQTEHAHIVFCWTLFYKLFSPEKRNSGLTWGDTLQEIKFLGESQGCWEHAKPYCLVERFLSYGGQLAAKMKARNHFAHQILLNWARPQKGWSCIDIFHQNCLQSMDYVQSLQTRLRLVFLGLWVILSMPRSDQSDTVVSTVGGSLQGDKEIRSWGWASEFSIREEPRTHTDSVFRAPDSSEVRDTGELWQEGPHITRRRQSRMQGVY